MIKSRLIKIERLIEPFIPQKPRRTWIVVDPDPDKRADKIRKGKIFHPIDGDPFKENDEFLKIRIVNVRPDRGRSPADFEAAFYAMAKGERIPNDGQPIGSRKNYARDKCLAQNVVESELDALKRRAAEIEKELEK